MIAVLATLVAAQMAAQGATAALAAEPPSPGPAAFEARMRASAAAAQALQGPWDGTWILSDARGRGLFVLQITDPADGGPLAGAWRETGAAGRTGWIDAIERRGEGLELDFTPPGQARSTVIRLDRCVGRSTSGWLAATGPRRPIRLTRAP